MDVAVSEWDENGNCTRRHKDLVDGGVDASKGLVKWAIAYTFPDGRQINMRIWSEEGSDEALILDELIKGKYSNVAEGANLPTYP